jgi:hypothetical protein
MDAPEFTMLNRTLEYDRPHSKPEKRQPGDPSAFGRADFQSYIAPVEDVILKYPGPALAAAFFVGVLVAWWIKRK